MSWFAGGSHVDSRSHRAGARRIRCRLRTPSLRAESDSGPGPDRAPDSAAVPAADLGDGGTSSIEGEYRLTVTASRSCSLPAEVRQRRYTARVTEAKPGYVTVALSGADFSFIPDELGGEAGFDGARNGDALRLVANHGYGGGYYSWSSSTRPRSFPTTS